MVLRRLTMMFSERSVVEGSAIHPVPIRLTLGTEPLSMTVKPIIGEKGKIPSD